MAQLGVLASENSGRRPRGAFKPCAARLIALPGMHDGPSVFPVECRLYQFGLVAVDDLELL